MSDEQHQRPTPGRVVWYQTDGRNYDYYVPAQVVITVDNLVRAAVEEGKIPDLTDEWHAHLWTPGGLEPYREFNVPFASFVHPARNDPYGHTNDGIARRSWRWPERI